MGVTDAVGVAIICVLVGDCAVIIEGLDGNRVFVYCGVVTREHPDSKTTPNTIR
jgi:hypothetical protein